MYFWCFIYILCDRHVILSTACNTIAMGHGCGSCVVHKIFLQLGYGSRYHWCGLHVLKNFFSFVVVVVFLQGGTHLEFLTLQDLGLSYWREQPCRVRRGATSVFDGRLTKVFCPWSYFYYMTTVFCQEDWDHLPVHWKTQLRSVFVTQTHALSTFLCP